ncbi:helix-turn-helix transcriptional regulator [Salimicrobium flavidum]|uniref:AraC-type DNA-binding protein n=1 Tax=Salimicrobium flavidum TaxID=570947 RepID=A0A1N7IZ62_9BACI|nr:AraC family transcriptional regulator [Salimicrobium flavidum]SIS42388.1 AraC-type DNA-binding protein [Salimicrobium flavidum]
MNYTETLYEKNLIFYQQLNSRFTIEEWEDTRSLLTSGDKLRFHETLMKREGAEETAPDDTEWESIKFRWKNMLVASTCHHHFQPSVQIFSLMKTIDEMGPESIQEGAQFLTEKIFSLFEEKEAGDNDFYSRHVKRSRNFIDRSLQNPALRLTMIAEELQLSPPYLSKLFHEEAGESITTYIHKKKIESSVDKLMFSNSSISDIAAECGYTSSTTFCRKFKELRGTTPLKYRRTYSM